MNVIVDTSVWSQVFMRRRPAESPETRLLTSLIQKGEDIFLIGIILQEILQGVRSKKQFALVRDSVAPFPMISLSRSDYIGAAALSNDCAGKGVQAGTVDFLIASTCIRFGCALLTVDRDFDRIARHTRLKLLKG